MSEEREYIEEEEGSSIDFAKIFQDLFKYKKLYYKVLPATFVIVALIALSLPTITIAQSNSPQRCLVLRAKVVWQAWPVVLV